MPQSDAEGADWMAENWKHRADDLGRLSRAYLAFRATPPSSEPVASRLWRVQFDVWYDAHRDPGRKPKQPECEKGCVIVQATDSEGAIKAALTWAENGLFRSKGRKFLSIEHRETAALKFPMEVKP